MATATYRAITARLSLLESLMETTRLEMESRKSKSPRLAQLHKAFDDLETALSNFQQLYNKADLTPKEYQLIGIACVILDAVCSGVLHDSLLNDFVTKITTTNPELKRYLYGS